MNQNTLDLVSNPFINLSHRFLQRVPAVTAALLFLVFGLFIARILRTMAERVLDRARLDEYAGKIGINEILTRLGLGRSPSYVISFLIYWFILLAFCVSAANALDLTVVAQLLEKFMNFLPSLIAAILIAFVGLLLARFLSEVVISAAQANNIRGGEVLGKCASAAIITFASLIALEQLDVHTTIIASSIQILFASLGLTFALAFGLGGRDLAAEFLRDVFNRKKT
ncbi:MAG: hypothetical protein HY078_10115 [Elusimicrobia bacterium]|nr:hypothetical protein [Elusimicrobiota bacterium]